MGQSQNIVDISKAYGLELDDIGKKAHELSELEHLGVPIPKGFIITTAFFEEFLKITGISKDIEKTKKTYHPSLSDSINKLFEPVRKKIMHTHMPLELATQLHEFYRKLAGEFKQVPVDIFSSSKTNKSLFFSDVLGDANVVLKIKTIWADHLDMPVAIVITKSIVSKIKGKTSTQDPSFDERLTTKQKNELSKYCKTIQNHFYFPKEIEYVIKDDKICITNLNPFTNIVNNLPNKEPQAHKVRKVLVKGISLNPGIVTGPAKILNKFNADTIIKKSEILIIPFLNASLYNNMKKAKAVVIDSILLSPKDKVTYRKNIQITTVEGAKNATKIIKNGNIITVNGINGEIYFGGLT